MNKFIAFLIALFPILAFADGSAMSFTPPASDYSVVFLGNIFGIVDGVLHGNGSQIMGSMFSVFNAAVLALGGIFIMYTLMVSTMNTAHEGEMMGKQWSSMWIPIRSTVGMTLLIPKASGYCMMQIFVMWIILQGVGAADKVWNAALNYLNRGGVIIQPQIPDPTAGLLATASGQGELIPMMAQSILVGQVCMLAIQKQLTLEMNNCNQNPTSPDPRCKTIYNGVSSIPDFVGSVNMTTIQSNTASTPENPPTTYPAPMPSIAEGPFQTLNGVCGTVSWAPLDTSMITLQLQASDLETVQNSRAIALQQMYMDLAAIANTMVDNDPQLGPMNPTAPQSATSVATAGYGIPETPMNTSVGATICTNNQTTNCTFWGSSVPAPTGNNTSIVTAPLFTGAEFQAAIQDYNAIMLPTLKLIQQSGKDNTSANGKAFMQTASAEGWIMAGSYFFNVLSLNISSSQSISSSGAAETLTDTTPGFTEVGLDKNLWDPKLSPLFAFLPPVLYTTVPAATGGDTGVTIQGLIDGTSVVGIDGTTPIGRLSPIPPALGTNLDSFPGGQASTVYGYTTNSYMLQVAGQPGMKPLQFANMMNMTINTDPYMLQRASFDCGSVNFGLISWCLGRMFGEVFYNFLFLMIYNIFIGLFGALINQVVMMFLMVPLEGMSTIFQQGLTLISSPGVSPIIGLAKMGTYYINFSAQLWLQLIEESIVAILIPVFGLFILCLIMMGMPLLMAWLGVMTSIGFTTAYYVPMLPYMIFTFGSIAWLMASIEAMVAAPIVALGVTHPEGGGSQVFGKGEPAIMILMNVFLRPSMMIIGYITAISLSYVSVWIINAGFDTAIGFIQGSSQFGTGGNGCSGANCYNPVSGTNLSVAGAGVGGGFATGGNPLNPSGNAGATPANQGGYIGWAGVYAFFFSILVYTTLYLTVVQKSFTLISSLPDKVLRWIGGSPEGYGEQTAQWGEESKGKIDKGAEATTSGQAQMDKQLSGAAGKALEGAKGSGGGGLEAKKGG